MIQSEEKVKGAEKIDIDDVKIKWYGLMHPSHYPTTKQEGFAATLL